MGLRTSLARKSAARRRPGACNSRQCRYYTTKQNCVLAQTFLRVRQYGVRAKARRGAGREPATAGNAAIIPDFNKKINTISVYCYKKALDICISLC